MSKKFATKFTSTDAKNYVRNVFDFEIIHTFKQKYYPEQQLAYLGLPGEDLLDILSWRQFINRWTGIQIVDTSENKAVADRMIRNALLNRLERGFQPIRGDVDEVLTVEASQQCLLWPYQVVNLDYYGGLVNAAEDTSSRRLNALQALFTHQVGAAFLLFITLNLRDKDRGELTKLVNDEEEELLGLELKGVKDCFDAHRELGHTGKLKIYLPIFLGAHATRHTLIINPPILYQGTKPMLHFTFCCIPYHRKSSGRIFRTRDHIAFINQPLYTLHSYGDLRKVELGKIEIVVSDKNDFSEERP